MGELRKLCQAGGDKGKVLEAGICLNYSRRSMGRGIKGSEIEEDKHGRLHKTILSIV